MSKKIAHATGALIFRLPEAISWNIETSDRELAGDTLPEFLEALGTMPPGTGVTCP